MNHSVEATPAFSLSAITSISAKDTEQVREHIAAAQPKDDGWLLSTITGELFAMAPLHRVAEGLPDNEVATWPRFFVAVRRIQEGPPMRLRTAGILLFEHQSDGSFRLDVWLTKADRNHGIEQAAFLQARSLITAAVKIATHFHCVALSPPWSSKEHPDVRRAPYAEQKARPGMSKWLYDHATEQWTEIHLLGAYTALSLIEAATVGRMVKNDYDDDVGVSVILALEQEDRLDMFPDKRNWSYAYMAIKDKQFVSAPPHVIGIIGFARMLDSPDSDPAFDLHTWFVRKARGYSLASTVGHDAQFQLSQIFGVDLSHIHFHATVQEGNHRPFFQPSAGQVGQWRHTETGGQPEVGHPAQWHHDASH